MVLARPRRWWDGVWASFKKMLEWRAWCDVLSDSKFLFQNQRKTLGRRASLQTWWFSFRWMDTEGSDMRRSRCSVKELGKGKQRRLCLSWYGGTYTCLHCKHAHTHTVYGKWNKVLKTMSTDVSISIPCVFFFSRYPMLSFLVFRERHHMPAGETEISEN